MPIYDAMDHAGRFELAQEQVYGVCMTGDVITLVQSATKDEFGETLTETTLSLHSFPTRTSPFTREITQKIGWAEKVDIIFYVALLEVSNEGETLHSLNNYKKVRHNQTEYEIEHIEHYSAFLNSFLYVIIGGKK